jgi:hypothetical protein
LARRGLEEASSGDSVTLSEMASESPKAESSQNPPDEPPPPPVPSSDPILAQQLPPTPDEQVASPQLAALTDDIFQVPPLAALKLLGAGVEALVRMTGDIPPTPPPTSPHVPNMRGMQAEKENIVRSHSERSLARMRAEAEAEAQQACEPTPTVSAPKPVPVPPAAAAQEIDGVRLRTPTPSSSGGGGGLPLTPTPTPEPYIVIGADSQPLNLQHSAITRKFYSKKAPPIGISDYLLRMHRFCPMSTAVYLAASLYIHRIAVTERAVAVTRRNAHRLLLAGLRVAMKALEDLSYPHSKVAKVGGVTDVELARLEISFCFLVGFELVVREDEMRRHWVLMKSGKAVGRLGGGGGLGDLEMPTLRLERRPRGGT